MEMPELAVIKHRCECADAIAPPGEHGVEHVFTLDGVEFPWCISEEGPRVVRMCEGLYAINVTILVRDVEVDGVEVADPGPGHFPLPVITPTSVKDLKVVSDSGHP